MRRASAALRALALSAVTLAASVARAADPVAAQALFEDARRLMAEGQYAEACPKLEESMRLDPGMGATFNLAECNEHEGRAASAWAGYLDVAASAHAVGQEARASAARARARGLEARLTTLTIVVDRDAPAALRVERNGALVGRGQWGTAVPIDPGEHVLTASLQGRTVWSTTVHVVADQPSTPLLVKVPPERELVALSPAQAPDDTNGAQEAGRGDGQRIVGVAVGGTGLVALGVGAAFGLRSMSARSDARAHCVGNACDAQGVDLRQSAMSSGNVSTAFVAIGAVAVASGIVLWLTAPRGAKSVGAVPTVGPQGGTLSLVGVW